MGRDAKPMLIGASARLEERSLLERVIEEPPEVVSVQELLTMVLGPKALLVTARIDLEDRVDAGRIEEVCNQIDRRLREALPEVTEVFLDATPGRDRD